METVKMDASSSEVSSTEEVVQALIEYLVAPVLPLKMSAPRAPSLSQQQSVAKQVHAVVLLYNYYQRKHHPENEFLGFESFCKLAVTLKPTLMTHMKLLQRSDNTEYDDLENQLSLTEKAIMDACNISLNLDASKDVPSMEGWPISRVAVFLIDPRKENCLLRFGSSTQGVWSVIEKDLEFLNINSESPVEGKHANKRKKISKKPLSDEQNADESGFRQLAFSAIKDATGINHTELMILESHVVYSLSKEKTASRLYIMQCTCSLNGELQPIKDAIESLQGPLVKKSSWSWTVTPVVEYYHVLPYAGILSDWLSREAFSIGMQDSSVGLGNANDNGSQRTENPDDKKVTERAEVFSNSLQNSRVPLENVNVNSSQRTENTCDEVSENIDISDKHDGVTDLNSSVPLESVNVNSSQSTQNTSDEISENIDISDKYDGVTDLNSSVPLESLNVNNTQNTENTCDEINENIDISDKHDGVTDFDDNNANCVINSQRTEKSCDDEVSKNIDRSNKSSGFADSSDKDGTRANSKEPTQGNDNEIQTTCLSNSSNGPQGMDIDDSCVVFSQNETKSKITRLPLKVYHHQRKRTSSTEGDINAPTSGVKVQAEMDDPIMKSSVTECKGKDVVTGNQICNIISADQGGIPEGDCALVPIETAKENDGSQTALRLLHNKKQKLSHQIRNLHDELAVRDKDFQTIFKKLSHQIHNLQDELSASEKNFQTIFEKLSHQIRNLQDEITLCDKNSQTILLAGGENDSDLNIDTIMDCGNDVCLEGKTQTQERTCHHFEVQGSSQYVEKILSEAILTLRPCQELDAICNENCWALPKYCLLPSDDGFLATVTVKGVDFECSSDSSLLSNPGEARESAAAQMIAKLRSKKAGHSIS